MASIRKWKSGWRAEVARKGVRRSKVFASRQEARDWAAHQEHLIVNAEKIAPRVPFKEILDRYAREVSPGKGGHKWEVVRLEKLGRDKLGDIALCDLTATDFADWRDRRLKEVSAASVRREMGLMGAVLTQARRDWGLIEHSPLADVRKPKQAHRRERRPTQDELDRLAHSAGTDLTKSTARAYHAFLFAIETAMRAGEVLGLRAEHVDLDRRVAHLPKTKNGTARDVPLSTEAVRLLRALPEADPLFNMSAQQLDALWRKLRDRAAVENLRFHDSRHEAITRLAGKLEVLDLARMVGHRDLKMLLVYYEASAEELATRLD